MQTNTIIKFTFQRQFLQNNNNSFYFDFPKSLKCDSSKIFDIDQVCSDFTLDIVQNKYLLCGFMDGNIIIYDVEFLNDRKLTKLLSLKKSQKTHKHNQPIRCIQWYPVDVGMFLSCGSDKKVKIWDSNTGTCVEEITLTSSVNWISLSSCSTKSNLVAAASDKSKTILVDLITGSPTHSLVNNYSDPVHTVQWSTRDEYLLATGDLGGHVSAWDIRNSRKPAYNLDQFQSKSSYSANSSNCQAHSSAVRGLEFSPDGFSLATLGNDGRVNIWDIFPSGIKLKDINFAKLSNTEKSSKNVRFSWSGFSNYKRLWIPSNLEIVRLDTEVGSMKRYLSGHFDKITSCIWNQGLHQFYSAGLDSTIMHWRPSLYQ